MWGDDLIIDEDADFAYVSTHRQNTIERIALESGAAECGERATEPGHGRTNGGNVGSKYRRRRLSGIFLD
jgi:hypothetical protein